MLHTLQAARPAAVRAALRPLALGAKGGTHSRGWYEKYKREGPAGFVKAMPPVAFDFDAIDCDARARRTRCWFELTVDEEHMGRVEFELVDELLPKTCANFRLLCGSDAPSGATYAGANFAMKILKDRATNPDAFLGGAVLADRSGSHSAFESRYFEDEGFLVPHSSAGILSMANSGVDTNASQFFVTLAPTPHMDGRCVAFGRVTSGLEVLTQICKVVYTQRGVPVQSVKILDCGVH